MRYQLIFSLLLISCSTTQAQSYKKIHFGAVLVDTHNDFLSKAVEDGVAFDSNLEGNTQSDLTRMRRGGIKVQIFSIFCDQHYGNGTAYAYANRELDSLYAISARNPGTMQLVFSYDQLRQSVTEHKLVCLSGVEGGHMIEDRLDYLDSFYRRGVRYMTLTWNNSTSWATSAKDESEHAVRDSAYGLTTFGKEVVKKMNQLGMMVDVSHVGERTFWDVIANTTRPIIASHSSVYTLCPVFRNLKDEQIRAVAKNGGVIQVNFFSGFLDSTYLKKMNAFGKRHKAESDSLFLLKRSEHSIREYFSKQYKDEMEEMRPAWTLVLDHIDYIVKLVGIDYVGLGSDFDGIDSSPKGLDGVQDYPKITEGLLERGYSKKEIRKILGENFLRVFKANDSVNSMPR